MSRWIQLLPISLVFLAGCAPNPAAAPVSSLTPPPFQLAQPLPTLASSPTQPPVPSSTPTPVPTASPTATQPPTSAPSPTPAVLLGAGDIVVCGVDTDEQTAAVVEQQLSLYPQ